MRLVTAPEVTVTQRVEGALATQSAYVPIALFTGDRSGCRQRDDPDADRLADRHADRDALVRRAQERRERCGPSAGPHDLPLVAAGAVLVIAIVVLGEAAGSLDVVAAVVGTLAAVAWWATPAVMAVRWVRRPW